ncbi:hypothetical protein ACYTD3_004382 [Escherichia coli]|nr:hypothetical protein [Escherichia coli]MBB7229351.1 hypothetical protein [Escherichia coli]
MSIGFKIGSIKKCSMRHNQQDIQDKRAAPFDSFKALQNISIGSKFDFKEALKAGQ